MRISYLNSDIYAWGDMSFLGLTKKRYVVFDLEATGADWRTDSITQIGAVVVCDSGPVDHQSFMSVVRPWKPIPEKIEKITGVTNTMIATAPDFATAYTNFRQFCAGSVLVTQCGYEFDFPLLEKECVRVGLPMMSNPRLDTKALFAYLHRDRKETFSTDFLSDHYGVDRSLFKRHDALGDALIIARIFHAEIAEARTMNVDSVVVTDPIKIRRFVLPPL